MHELLLHATVPSTRHHQVLSVLAGIAAMQPVSISEQHLVFKPLQQPAGPGRPNLNQGVGAQMKPLQGQMHGDLFYLKLVGEIRESSKNKGSGAEVTVREVDEKGEGQDVDMVLSFNLFLTKP